MEQHSNFFDRLQKYWAIIVALVGLVGGYSTMNYRLNIQDKQIIELKNKQDNTDIVLGNISNQLSELNAKVGLIVEGKVTFVLGEK